ncbi:uncharacterized protein PV07_11778 [Cladophialophora immunda]|uniref:Uncharacterized protein n=1 Tax=Cladophialophora immunda TaxID=569365 RepID=A0A0D1Z7K6_9EURO|nr:uncharacterized protein PV07_11778 [Cladophialophora immunda]KIW23591.1 hypothetical protein PV07_11778 [Cladophialophora immunda]
MFLALIPVIIDSAKDDCPSNQAATGKMVRSCPDGFPRMVSRTAEHQTNSHSSARVSVPTGSGCLGIRRACKADPSQLATPYRTTPYRSGIKLLGPKPNHLLSHEAKPHPTSDWHMAKMPHTKSGMGLSGQDGLIPPEACMAIQPVRTGSPAWVALFR